MIIWINGTYGVGKSSVANEIRKQLVGNDVVVFESDELFRTLGEEILLNFVINRDGPNPQNNRFFLNRVRDKIKEYLYTDTICIVPMALTSIEGKEIVWDYIVQNCKRFYHFVLEAEESIVRERIMADLKRPDKNLALQELRTNNILIKKHFPDAIRIDACKKIDEVAQEIIGCFNK